MDKFYIRFKESKFFNKKYLSIFLHVICILLLSKVLIIGAETYSKGVTNEISNHLIRFHLLANSDSLEDQQLKEHIRDEILTYMNPILKDSPDIETTRSIIISESDNIKRLSQQVVKAWGKDYKVEVRLEKVEFPTKEYGDIILPAGEYEACRIIIGEGKGKNWWCVMFPPLCYVDVTHGIVPVEEKEQLEKVLSPEEFKLITKPIDKDSKDVKVKFKFKIVEVFNERKQNK